MSSNRELVFSGHCEGLVSSHHHTSTPRPMCLYYCVSKWDSDIQKQHSNTQHSKSYDIKLGIKILICNTNITYLGV